ncbi:MAG: HIT family protein [Candidatus Nomurabacteria bacterium]|nr:HIT family protein [Candidatus Nomurabacteria bacterium]
MQDCIFCKIIKKEIPCEKVYEDETVLAFLDINPVNLGHTLVVPKKHFENIYDIEENEVTHLIKIAKKISIALKKMGADGTNITINNGKAAGQVIPHFHTHVIPRSVEDNLPLWPAKKPKEGELKEVAKKIISML